MSVDNKSVQELSDRAIAHINTMDDKPNIKLELSEREVHICMTCIFATTNMILENVPGNNPVALEHLKMIKKLKEALDTNKQ